MKVSSDAHRLEKGSILLKRQYWEAAEPNVLKVLIQRFSTRERRYHKFSRSSYMWRTKRLSAIEVYEKRFGAVPELFKSYRLPKQHSYYVRDGKIIWPKVAQQAHPGDGKKRRA